MYVHMSTLSGLVVSWLPKTHKIHIRAPNLQNFPGGGGGGGGGGEGVMLGDTVQCVLP